MTNKNTLYFRAICEEGSLLGAAHRLGMTQPSFSKFISQLEQELNVQLFQRTKKGLILTEAGKAYLDYCGQFEQLYNKMRLNLSEISGQSIFNLKIGITPARGFYIIPDLFPRFKELRPVVQLELVEKTARELEWMLTKRDIHVALFTIRDQMLDNSLKSYPIGEERILLLINKDKLAAIEDSLGRKADIKDFNNLPFILLPESTRIGQIGYLQYKRANLSSDIIYVQNLETAVQLAKSGFGITFSSEIAMRNSEKRKQLAGLQLDGNLSWTYIAATHEDYDRFSVVQDFIKTAQQVGWRGSEANI